MTRAVFPPTPWRRETWLACAWRGQSFICFPPPAGEPGHARSFSATRRDTCRGCGGRKEWCDSRESAARERARGSTEPRRPSVEAGHARSSFMPVCPEQQRRSSLLTEAPPPCVGRHHLPRPVAPGHARNSIPFALLLHTAARQSRQVSLRFLPALLSSPIPVAALDRPRERSSSGLGRSQAVEAGRDTFAFEIGDALCMSTGNRSRLGSAPNFLGRPI